MATTYTKAMKSIEVKTLGGQTITAADTKDNPIASNALYEFEEFKTMHIKTETGVTLVPFHAVDSIAVTTTTESVTRADAYCPEETPEP